MVSVQRSKSIAKELLGPNQVVVQRSNSIAKELLGFYHVVSYHSFYWEEVSVQRSIAKEL